MGILHDMVILKKKNIQVREGGEKTLRGYYEE